MVGSSSVVLPNVVFEEGACLGALSLAKHDLESYKLYAGIPARIIKSRNKEQIQQLEKQLKDGK